MGQNKKKFPKKLKVRKKHRVLNFKQTICNLRQHKQTIGSKVTNKIMIIKLKQIWSYSYEIKLSKKTRQLGTYSELQGFRS